MFFLRNLSSSEVLPGDPWAMPVKIPPKCREDKGARDEWINRPTTRHCCYSGWEGINQGARITSRKDGENPPYKLHALVMDFDATATDEQIVKYCERLPWAPAYLERTLTPGHWRLIFLLEEPLIFAGFDSAEYFLGYLEDDLKLRNIPGFDSAAFNKPGLYYTSSGDLFATVDAPVIPKAEIMGKFILAFEKYSWTEFKTQWNIPVDVIRDRLAERYPEFSRRWQGDFAIGAQGPSFWIQESVSPKSAIIKDGGIFTFSSHAAQPFYSWAELLGADFVKKYQEVSLGSAAEGIYRADNNYWRKLPDGAWRSHRLDDITRILRNSGVSEKKDGGSSPMDLIIAHIAEHNRVEGVGNFIFNPDGILHRDGKRFLNICTTRVLEPAAEFSEWGPSGKFPWLSEFFDSFFDPKEQLTPFLCWVAWAYQGFYRQEPHNGQILQIFGEQNVGKTMLNQGILARLFGGHRECKEFLTGQDQFNAELFEAGYWTIDDGSISSDYRTHRRFSEMAKRAAANQVFRCRMMHQCAVTVSWQGRIGITANVDPESLRSQLLDVDISLLDKLMLFRTARTPGVKFVDTKERIKQELPHFARWILEYQIPDEWKPEHNRFGVRCYHEESLLQAARQTSVTSSFGELINAWKVQYFKEHKGATYWEGNAFDLYSLLNQEPATMLAMKDTPLRRLPVELEKLELSDGTVESLCSTDGRIWRIHRNDSPQTPPELPPAPTRSKFNRD